MTSKDSSSYTQDAATAIACERCGILPHHNHSVCCSSHNKVLCHPCYKRTHFVEVCSCGLCKSEAGLASVSGYPLPSVDKSLDFGFPFRLDEAN